MSQTQRKHYTTWILGEGSWFKNWISTSCLPCLRNIIAIWFNHLRTFMNIFHTVRIFFSRTKDPLGAESLHRSSGKGGLPKLLKWWSYIDVWPFCGKVKFAAVCLQGYTIFFLFLLKTIDCGYSLEPPHWGSSNEYPQFMFWAEIWKNIDFFIWKFFQFLESIYRYLKRRVFVMLTPPII